jgi:hypothetical protein
MGLLSKRGMVQHEFEGRGLVNNPLPNGLGQATPGQAPAVQKAVVWNVFEPRQELIPQWRDRADVNELKAHLVCNQPATGLTDLIAVRDAVDAGGGHGV